MIRENVILADCVPEEVESLVKGLTSDSGTYAIRSHISNWKRTGKFSEIKRYATYFYVGFRYFLRRNRIGTLIGWQQFYALIFCFFCELFQVRKQNTVVALNYTYKEKSGKAGKLYRWFMEMCMSPKYLDYLHVPSDSYAYQISRDFSFPRERIIVTPFGINDDDAVFSGLASPAGYEKNGYALAIGRSNRDYDFLIRAWKTIPYPLVIISDTYSGSADAENITLLNNVAGEESYPWIANCGLMVIPIDDGSICSGDTVLLTAMAVRRKLLVTIPSTLAEMYIQDGQNALLVEKQEEPFREKVNQLLFSDAYIHLGEQARESFLKNFSRESMGKKVSEKIQ